MPLVGLIDPSHTGMKKAKRGVMPTWYTTDAVLEMLLDHSPKWAPWTYELAAAAIGEHQERGDRLSVTTVTGGCERGTVIERMEDWVGVLDWMYPSMRGIMYHTMLEGYAREEGIAEARFYGQVRGIEISGSPDLLTTDTVWDYKVTESPPTFGYPYSGHTEQLMLNAYIARHTTHWEHGGVENGPLAFDPRDHPATRICVVYMGPKWPKPVVYERKEEFYTPAGKLVEAKRPYIYTDKEIDDKLGDRIEMMRTALDIYPEWPEGAEDLWGGAAGWHCPGWPVCNLPNCLAKREPENYVWGEAA